MARCIRDLMLCLHGLQSLVDHGIEGRHVDSSAEFSIGNVLRGSVRCSTSWRRTFNQFMVSQSLGRHIIYTSCRIHDAWKMPGSLIRPLKDVN